MTPTDPLAPLNPLRQPEAISWWPLAPCGGSWWLLATPGGLWTWKAPPPPLEMRQQCFNGVYVVRFCTARFFVTKS